MKDYSKGDIIVMPLPYSDFSGLKERPTLIVANVIGDDIIVCEITSKERIDSISIEKDDLKEGSLFEKSFIRPGRIFTVNRLMISYKIGSLKELKIKEVEKNLIKIISS